MTLRALPDFLTLEIIDDGRGFEHDDGRGGPANMRCRAELCHGSLSISSRPGEGTDVLLTVPLDGQEVLDPGNLEM